MLVNEHGPDASPHFFGGGPLCGAALAVSCADLCRAMPCSSPGTKPPTHPSYRPLHCAGVFSCIPAMSRMVEERLVHCFKTGAGIR